MTPVRPLRIAAATAASALACVLPATASAATRIAVEPFASKIAAYGGVLAWSHWDATAGVFRLAIRIHGHTVLPAVAPRAVPFDVTLGPDARGRTVAVYSRCRTPESAIWTAGSATARVPLPVGCRIVDYDLASRREHAVAAVPSSGSNYLPTLWRSTIAYVRVGSSGSPVVYVQPLSAPVTTVRGKGGKPVARRGRIVARALPGGDRTATGPGPVGLSLRGGTLAMDWQGGDPAGTWTSDLLIDTIPATFTGTGRGRPTQITADSETASAGAPGFLLGPTVNGGAVGYGVFDGSSIAPPGDSVRRVSASGDGAASVTGPAGLRAVAFDGSLTYTLSGPYGGQFAACPPPGCRLVARRGL